MSQRSIDRRTFLHATAASAAGSLLAGSLEAASAAEKPLKILDPFPGAVLNHRHGAQKAEGLTIRVSGEAPADARVTVNGVPAQREAKKFTASIVLRDKESDIVATAEGQGGRCQDRVRVVWDRYSVPRYRFSIDDNSFFLRDIAQKGYRSLFDCWYLKALRDLHAKYGVKYTLNIYYTTGSDFSLPQFSDRYKSEWRDNGDWLRLAFHAYANDPDRPYQDTPPEKMLADMDLVEAEIHRFAGKEAFAPPTVIHWGMIRPSAFKPLARRGVRVLSGFFKHGNRYDVNYRLNDTVSEYLSKHDAWKDFESGLVFSLCDIVCNNVPVDRTAATLEKSAQNPDTAEIMDLFTHEQYFWPFYARYIPDHPQRLDAAIRWVTEHGYKPVFFHEGFLGGRE